MQLQRGEKKTLADLGVGPRLSVAIDYGLAGVDVAAFGLNKDRRIGDDRYVVLFSNSSSPEGAIRLTATDGKTSFALDLDVLPSTIDRIVFTATHDAQPIANAKPLVVTLDNGKASFNAGEHLTSEKAVMLIEIYRYAAGWRIGTIAAGFNGGLASLIEHFGGEIGDVSAPSLPPTSNANSPPVRIPVPTTTPVVPPPPGPPVSLRKVTLEKNNSRVSLTKTGSTFGEIILNLNWSQQAPKKGFFGGASRGGIDLDLGVLYELKDGTRGVIQALGNTFGSYDRAPWIHLSGDDRTGAVAAGETIRVNGRHFDEIKRLGIFALIYEGVPNWQQTDGVVTMKIPGQPDVDVRLDEGRDNCRLCGVATIENIGGQLSIDRHMRYYSSQQPFADDIGIILRWKAGTKN